ncbi:hypothetical protein [Moorena sp. SIO1G6]|nr:hypothetical protein [Moorena sp. SIO1G6]
MTLHLFGAVAADGSSAIQGSGEWSDVQLSWVFRLKTGYSC